MKFHCRLQARQYEERLKEIRNERMAEAKQIERLFAALVRKTDTLKPKELAERVA
jgi:hypothetical protein